LGGLRGIKEVEARSNGRDELKCSEAGSGQVCHGMMAIVMVSRGLVDLWSHPWAAAGGGQGRMDSR
jgi:hypothetical protein